MVNKWNNRWFFIQSQKNKKPKCSHPIHLDMVGDGCSSAVPTPGRCQDALVESQPAGLTPSERSLKGMSPCITGWWLGHPSEKYEFVNWDDELPNINGKTKLMATKPPTRLVAILAFQWLFIVLFDSSRGLKSPFFLTCVAVFLGGGPQSATKPLQTLQRSVRPHPPLSRNCTSCGTLRAHGHGSRARVERA